MTIEELANEATDTENFSHDGNVVVFTGGETHPVKGAWYDAEKKELVINLFA